MPPKRGPGSFSTMNALMPSLVRAASATRPDAFTVRHPRLGAVDDVLVAVALGAAGDVAGVAARVGLAQRERAAPLRGRQLGEPALLLLIGAVHHQQRGHHRVGVEDAGEAHPAGGELLDDADVGEQIQPEPAVLLGDGHPEQPELAHRLRRCSSGNSSARSSSATAGTTSRVTNRRTLSMISCRISGSVASALGWTTAGT